MDEPQKVIPGAAFYDAVASDYNSHMTENDRRAREIIRNQFTAIVSPGNVMDFGGGTGLDLPWLTANNNYRVFFLETSANMRAVAKQQHGNDVNFIENTIDFNDWSPMHLPVKEKMDGILANFAVLNSIQNMDSFFEKMALICNSGCKLFLTVLDSRLPIIIKKYPFKTWLTYVMQRRLAITNRYNNITHTTYIHSLSVLKAASAGQFNFISYKPIAFSNFVLLILSKK